MTFREKVQLLKDVYSLTTEGKWEIYRHPRYWTIKTDSKQYGERRYRTICYTNTGGPFKTSPMFETYKRYNMEFIAFVHLQMPWILEKLESVAKHEEQGS